jgi:alpha-galactosidase
MAGRPFGSEGRKRACGTTLRAMLMMIILSLGVAGATATDGAVADSQAASRAWIGELLARRARTAAHATQVASRYPFSFVYAGRRSDDLPGAWPSGRETIAPDADRTRILSTWTDPRTRLRVEWHAIRYADFPAAEWVLYFENAGNTDTGIIEEVRALDLNLASPIATTVPYRLHKTNGAPANPTDFEPAVAVIDGKHAESTGGGGGRSSNKDLPFFKIDTGKGALIVAVGWSGQWKAQVECPDNRTLHVTAGLEKTHFVLHPGERVRSPRVLVLYWEGDTLESNAQFRRLIYRHYVATRNGRKPLPTLFCNTCFTRGGGWLNECNAANQISLINAYAPLGLEALLTDAGWFEGGWPAGAGNWNPRRDAYPDGMGPVAAAAKAKGMIYGLWFEPERVVKGTWLHKNHPEWLLAAGPEPQGTYLLNFGLPEVQDYFFGTVKGFMDLPGFRVYRQDFNMDPLPHWRFNEPPDRQGITEMKYIDGLYAYWDRIARAWPDSLREECASGGRRIDLETVMRMHIHQDSDYWFDNEADQAQIWGLSQYLPNNVFVSHLNRTDDYSFHSTLASSLCMGWIADAPDFDSTRGKWLLEKYRAVRHLLVGAWYPLLPYSRDPAAWMASQYHRPDLDEGLIVVLRHPKSPYRSVRVSLHGLTADATYELSFEITGQKRRVSGAELMRAFELTIPERHRSEMIVYRGSGLFRGK